MKSKKNYINLPRRIKASLLCFFFILFVLLFIAVFVYAVFKILPKFGLLINASCAKTIQLALLVSFFIVNIIMSVVLIQYPFSTLSKFMDAFDAVAAGDFSVRLAFKKTQILKKSGDTFNNMVMQLENTETLSNDFISNFSHEFKTPLSSICGFAQLLKNQDLSPETENEYLDIIIQESERMKSLSDNILTLLNLERQTILTNKERINITELMRITIGSLYPQWEKKKLDIIFDGDEYTISGNKDMLSQAWINLLDNAIKFSPENHEIYVSITKINDSICVSIINDGNTIPKEHINRIFEKFYQGDVSRTTKGNGLGLTTVKKIIEIHDGKISVEVSEPDQIKFEILLPVAS